MCDKKHRETVNELILPIGISRTIFQPHFLIKLKLPTNAFESLMIDFFVLEKLFFLTIHHAAYV